MSVTIPSLDCRLLEPVLDAAGLGWGPIVASPIGDGHSNLTYRLVRGEEHWVLRRPPQPPYPPSTHDVLREHRFLEALAGSGARTPRPRLAVADTSLIGVPFYVMDLVDGTVLTNELPPELEDPAQRAHVGPELVDALIELHAFDWQSSSLRVLHGRANYLDRQLKTFAALWKTYRARPIPAIDEAHRRLVEARPAPGETTLVHGDLRLGNTLFSLDGRPRVTAILDWEMAAIGDPLADLGYLLSTWAEPGDSDGALLELGALTALPGFSPRAELAARYVAGTGRDVSALAWYEALASWKSAVLLEGSYQRMLDGASDDEFFERLASGVPQLADRAISDLDRL